MEEQRSAESIGEAAGHLDAQADSLWLLACDCRRWGLCETADETRKLAIEARVRALINRALAGAGSL